MELVYNERLLDYMCPSADTEKVDLAIRLLNAVVQRCDKIVLRHPSPFVLKFYRYRQQYGYDANSKERVHRKIFSLG